MRPKAAGALSVSLCCRPVGGDFIAGHTARSELTESQTRDGPGAWQLAFFSQFLMASGFSLPGDYEGMTFLDIVNTAPKPCSRLAPGDDPITPVEKPLKWQRSQLFDGPSSIVATSSSPETSCCQQDCVKRGSTAFAQRVVETFNKYSHDEQQAYLFDYIKGQSLVMLSLRLHSSQLPT